MGRGCLKGGPLFLGVTGFSINKNISGSDFDFERPSFVVLQRVQSEKSCISLLPPLFTSFRTK